MHRTEREGYSGFKDLLEKNGIKTKELPMLQKAEVDKRIAPSWSSAVRRTVDYYPARSRCRQEVRRRRW